MVEGCEKVLVDRWCAAIERFIQRPIMIEPPSYAKVKLPTSAVSLSLAVVVEPAVVVAELAAARTPMILATEFGIAALQLRLALAIVATFLATVI